MDFAALLREERRKAAATRHHTANAREAQINEKTIVPDVRDAAVDLAPLQFARRLPVDLELSRVCKSIISSVHYIPDWLSCDEERAILDRVAAAPSAAWVQLKHRRLQVHGGTVTNKYTPAPLPSWLQALSTSFVEMGLFDTAHTPNHALINEYRPGDYILPHEDGPLYHPLVAIVSLGANAVMSFKRHRHLVDHASSETIPIRVNRRSLIVFTDQAYTEHLHSIDDVAPATRVSLTIRHALSL
ncbi:hypothetical protein H310_07142, partial [Aphanomyces invadans]